MNGGNDEQELRRPIMQVADESPEWNVIGDDLNRERGFLWIRDVVEHFEDARHAEDEHEEDGCPACAQGVTPARLCSWNGWRVEVVKKRWSHGIFYG